MGWGDGVDFIQQCLLPISMCFAALQRAVMWSAMQTVNPDVQTGRVFHTNAGCNYKECLIARGE